MNARSLDREFSIKSPSKFFCASNYVFVNVVACLCSVISDDSIFSLLKLYVVFVIYLVC